MFSSLRFILAHLNTDKDMHMQRDKDVNGNANKYAGIDLVTDIG